MNVAVIPARGGSKRIPRKNVRDFCGKPMIAYSIEAALESGCFGRVVVSTDDGEVAEVARACGAEVPFMRAAELAGDHTPTIPVVRHAIESLIDSGCEIGHVCCLYATAPFVQAEDLRRGLAALRGDGEAMFAVSVTSFGFPIFRALKIDESGERMSMFWPEHELTRSQDLPEAYHDAGQFYWGTVKAYRTQDGFFSGVSLPVALPRWRVRDIDTEEDWRSAEVQFRVTAGGSD